jgi:hypothetical protein
MKRLSLCALALLLSMCLLSFADEPKTKPTPATPPRDVPTIAEDEIARRGNLVEVVGENRADIANALAEAMRPPADDSHKWFISLVTMQGCPACDRLKTDIASSPHLRPFVNTADEKASWSHYNIFQREDETQAWRWKEIKLNSFPTLLVQPPRNGSFGNARTVVLQITGYNGDAKALAQKLRLGLGQYVAKYNAARATAHGHQQASVAHEQAPTLAPPFSPPSPPKVEPTPANFPFEIPPVPSTPPNQTPTPNSPSAFSALSLLVSLAGNLLSSGGTTNLLLVVIAGLAVIRTLRKATGQTLLLDDDSFQAVIDTLRNVLSPTATKNPTNPD